MNVSWESNFPTSCWGMQILPSFHLLLPPEAPRHHHRHNLRHLHRYQPEHRHKHLVLNQPVHWPTLHLLHQPDHRHPSLHQAEHHQPHPPHQAFLSTTAIQKCLNLRNDPRFLSLLSHFLFQMPTFSQPTTMPSVIPSMMPTSSQLPTRSYVLCLRLIPRAKLKQEPSQRPFSKPLKVLFMNLVMVTTDVILTSVWWRPRMRWQTIADIMTSSTNLTIFKFVDLLAQEPYATVFNFINCNDLNYFSFSWRRILRRSHAEYKPSQDHHHIMYAIFCVYLLPRRPNTVVATRTFTSVKPAISPSNVAQNANSGTVLDSARPEDSKTPPTC